MTAICPDCGKDSLMFGNIGAIFGIPPYCANIDCPSQELGDLEWSLVMSAIAKENITEIRKLDFQI